MGESSGHPFRGNQWTTGVGGGDRTGDREEPAIVRSEGDYAKTPTATESLLESAATVTNYTGGHIQLTDEGRAEIGRLHIEAVTAAQALGVRTNSFLAQNDAAHPDARLIAKAVEAQAMFKVAAAIKNMPQAAQDYIKEHGLQLELTTGEPEKFLANGREFQRGGAAQGYDKDLKVNLHSFPEKGFGFITHRDAAGNEIPDPRIGLPKGFNTELVGHEMGHIAIDISGNLNLARIKEYNAGDETDRAGHLAGNVQEIRLASRDMVGDYNRGAQDLEKLANDAYRAGKTELATHLNAQSQYYRNLSEETMETVRGLSPAQEALFAKAKTQDDWLYEHDRALGDLTQAVNEEGGITNYAHEWHQDPQYGKGGNVRDPVHRGVHETVAEVEGGYLNYLRSNPGGSVKDYARRIAEGEAAIVGIRSRVGVGKEAGRVVGENHTKYPKVAKAWASWRKTLESPKAKFPKFRLSKDVKESLDKHRNKNYYSVKRQHEAAQREIQSEIDKARAALNE